MHPIRVLKSQSELAALPNYSIVSSPENPDWGAVKNGDDSWMIFGAEGTRDSAWAWGWLSEGIPAEAWLLWDPTGPAPHVPAKVWRTTIPDRSPEVKLHKTLGHARSAVTNRISSYPGFAHYDMRIEELNTATNQFFVLHDIRSGTRLDSLPWK
ncbi:hypothetical protein [Arthrobacter caoxuetaonis]|uniref:Uncharacterized protein n=1 Tax=Arthrobacter caoxuetaonis TaxID=2886935 RepID=A0A9X1MIG3_9MICC|nr:hypothetical protein [Arthrobacter caoxuetaonis]MCC3299805.1 hypothetical protein [Arthrobacter caoxuetaonis]USQ59295.1 hypothetical protein NF551_17065 [Arthrobacter caoxuetaonis]